MKPRGTAAWLLAAVFTTTLLLAPTVQARTPDRDRRTEHVRRAPAVDLNFFYDTLAPYGEWIDLPQWGWAWYPEDMPAGWQPYTWGQWAFTDWGWTWESHWDWGWAPFHYGRWVDDDDYGWLWVPGYDWGPAWVAWDAGGDWIGWAPLPPQAEWDPDEGLRISARSLDRRIPDRDFAFVRARDLTDHDLHDEIAPRARDVTIAPETHDVTRYQAVGGVPVDRSVSPDRIAHAVGHPIVREPVEEVRSAAQLERQRGRHGQALPLFRPTIDHERPMTPPRSHRISPNSKRGRAELQAMQQRHQHEERAMKEHQAQERQQLETFHRQQLTQLNRHARGTHESHHQMQQQARSEQLQQQAVHARQNEREGMQQRAVHAQQIQNEQQARPREERLSPSLGQQQAREHRFMAEQQQREMHQMRNRHRLEMQQRFRQPQRRRPDPPERPKRTSQPYH